METHKKFNLIKFIFCLFQSKLNHSMDYIHVDECPLNYVKRVYNILETGEVERCSGRGRCVMEDEDKGRTEERGKLSEK